MQDNKVYSALASAIINSAESSSQNAISTAQYDKSFTCKILGVNTEFADTVTSSEQSTLIATYKIPNSVNTNESQYYTIKINGRFFVVRSNTVFKLYEDVVAIIPKGDWNRIRISSLTPSSDNKKGVRFTVNKLYYGEEEYNLQRGNDKRILCVTQGNKGAIIQSETEAESEVSALSEVMKGLEVLPTIQYEMYVANDGYYVSPMSSCPFEDGVDFEVDYGDGTDKVTGTTNNGWNIDSHVYTTKGLYIIKIWANAKICKLSSHTIGFCEWEWTNQPDYDGRGIRAHIGGTIEEVNGSSGYTTCVTWGESVKKLTDSSDWGGNDSKITENNDMALPPFIQEVNGSFRYMTSNYLYIPASCTVINNGSFQYSSYSKVEISPEGNTLTISDSSLKYFSNTEGDTVHRGLAEFILPKRVVTEINAGLLQNCALRTLFLEPGRTQIMYSEFYDSNRGGFRLGNITLESSKVQQYAFIPRTIQTINGSVFSSPCTIVYQGSESEWANIVKYGYVVSDTPDLNIVYLDCNDRVFKNTYDTVAKLEKSRLTGSEGILVSNNQITLQPATSDSLGGVRPSSSDFHCVDGYLTIIPQPVLSNDYFITKLKFTNGVDDSSEYTTGSLSFDYEYYYKGDIGVEVVSINRADNVVTGIGGVDERYRIDVEYNEYMTAEQKQSIWKVLSPPLPHANTGQSAKYRTLFFRGKDTTEITGGWERSNDGAFITKNTIDIETKGYTKITLKHNYNSLIYYSHSVAKIDILDEDNTIQCSLFPNAIETETFDLMYSGQVKVKVYCSVSIDTVVDSLYFE